MRKWNRRNAVVKVSKDLTEAEVFGWPVNKGLNTKLGVPTILGIDPDKVTIHFTVFRLRFFGKKKYE